MALKAESHHKHISYDEAIQAIYVDCEGFENSTPLLMGVQVGEKIEQIVLDHNLEQAAIAKGLRVSSFQEEVQSLVRRSEAEHRWIVAYTQHERELFLSFAGIDVDRRYRDAHKIAKRWRSIKNPIGIGPGNGLKDFLVGIGYERG